MVCVRFVDATTTDIPRSYLFRRATKYSKQHLWSSMPTTNSRMGIFNSQILFLKDKPLCASTCDFCYSLSLVSVWHLMKQCVWGRGQNFSNEPVDLFAIYKRSVPMWRRWPHTHTHSHIHTLPTANSRKNLSKNDILAKCRRKHIKHEQINNNNYYNLSLVCSTAHTHTQLWFKDTNLPTLYYVFRNIWLRLKVTQIRNKKFATNTLRISNEYGAKISSENPYTQFAVNVQIHTACTRRNKNRNDKNSSRMPHSTFERKKRRNRAHRAKNACEYIANNMSTTRIRWQQL